MTHTYLLEIGLEEMPSRFILSSVEQLKDRMAKYLDEENIAYEAIQTFSTPRRLAIEVTGLSSEQPDRVEVLRGPSKKAGVDAEGNWSKAAQGFARSKGIDLDDLYLEDVKGTEYLFAKIEIKGKQIKDILLGAKDIVEAMNFPINMRWANYSFEYLRPVHWLVSLLDDEVIPFEVFNVEAGNSSRGHRFLGKETTIAHAKDYKQAMEAVSVLVDREERKQLIVSQLRDLENEHKWAIREDEALLNEVTDMVEYPTAFYGTFSEDFLKVPEQALVLSMKDHQRYFDVRDEDNQVLAYFVAIRNGDDAYIDNVRKGNEKVINARLADATFFYEEDLKVSIDDSLAKLDRMGFYEGMGSLRDKSHRVAKLARHFGEMVGLTDEQLNQVTRAATIAKFDLVTNMVNEFPELQGIMGEIYANEKGETKEVAQAIREQYMPLSSHGELPESELGTILSVAEKLDNLMMFFHSNVIPTGSNDPFALRRQAYGLIRILGEKGWAFPLNAMLTELSDVILPAEMEQKEALISFLLQRIQQLLSTQGYRYDVIESVLASKQDQVLALKETVEALHSHVEDEDFKDIIESLVRVSNLAKKADAETTAINEELFETDSEKNLAAVVEETMTKFNVQANKEEQYGLLKALHHPIDAFFEDNMVMADDEAVKNNRLTLLKSIDDLVLQFAGVNKLVIK